jgi:hypothetical protein
MTRDAVALAVAAGMAVIAADMVALARALPGLIGAAPTAGRIAAGVLVTGLPVMTGAGSPLLQGSAGRMSEAVPGAFGEIGAATPSQSLMSPAPTRLATVASAVAFSSARGMSATAAGRPVPRILTMAQRARTASETTPAGSVSPKAIMARPSAAVMPVRSGGQALDVGVTPATRRDWSTDGTSRSVSDIGPVAAPRTAPAAQPDRVSGQTAAPTPWGVTARPMAPSAPAARSNGSPEGVLDEMRFGRWVMDLLGREASRPQTGATAFDPRLGVAWPGTLQGG